VDGFGPSSSMGMAASLALVSYRLASQGSCFPTLRSWCCGGSCLEEVDQCAVDC
jgi:hypothetical protein